MIADRRPGAGAAKTQTHRSGNPQARPFTPQGDQRCWSSPVSSTSSFFSSRRRHTRYWRDWSSDVCSSDLSVERGYLLLPQGLRAVMQGEVDKAYEIFAQAAAIGQKYDERDLLAMALHGQGRAAIRRGEIEIGRASCRERVEISVDCVTVTE